ncbi:dienelactone hydrolase family protein [Actinokineospora globicatena]|uniref:dienelactone hydrolase family protein n=1 Tax=Actinokineospora globicatena TaxID=103729 RepID=UPI0020A4F3D6|nr:dienelactone hydrolase family protein [Actinokineospora globicatena]MCP2303658.1 Alpha/beta hydrolase family protein [Actinokineospora globicatena]GLW79205.1 hydrolase [Actinokineospora globicatena]GLW86385.1 hydrolase [Actinokineospora globicatena]
MSVIELPARLEGDLVAPPGAPGIVLFAHGHGSSRHSPRNQAVAKALNDHDLATLLMDLHTEDEDHAELDTVVLTSRLLAAIDWVEAHEPVRRMKVGVFGASTGAAAALHAAAARPWTVAAVVTRGGSPYTATALEMVAAPTLLIAGEHDPDVVSANQHALRQLGGPADLRVVLGATHLFPELGAMARVTELATDWFTTHLTHH